MFLRTVETAFARYQAKGEAAALAIVFDRTAPELLRLARHLAGDAALAEDLVQATFLTAIESAQSHVHGRPVLPWLCGILANHARTTRRRERRIPDPSRLRGDVVRDAASEAERRELQADVGEAIAKLPEVYRPVLRLWLEHGLEAHEIAATLERPAGTVRAQVTRGLDLLRRALPASLAGATAIVMGTGRGLAAVRADVLGTCGATSTTIASTLAIGGLLVLHHKLLVGGIAAALALLLWFTWSPPAASPDAGNGGSPSNAFAATGESTSPVPAAPDAGELASQRDAVPAPIAVDPAPPPRAATELVVKLRNAGDGQPLVGYGVAVRRASDLQNFAAIPTFVASDESGDVRFTGIEPGTWLLDIDRRGPVMTTDVIADRYNEQVVELEPSGVIHGHVIGPDGQPVPGAEILGHGNRLSPPVLTRTDRNGRFELRHLGELELQAKKPGYAPSLSQPVLTTANAQFDVSLQLGASNRRLAGTARTHQGEPLAMAAIAIMQSAARHAHPWDRDAPQHRAIWLRTDPQGRFETTEVGAGHYLVVAVPTDRSTPPTLAEADTTDGDGFVDLRCPEPTIIEGRITENGVAATLTSVVAFPEQPSEDIGYLLNLVGLRIAAVDAKGAFRITGMVPGLISLRAVRGNQVLAETHRQLAAGATMRWDADPGATSKLRIHVKAPVALPNHLMALINTRVDGAAPTMVAIDAGGEAEVELHRSGPVDVTLAVYDHGVDVVQLARCRNLPVSQPELNVELSREQLPVGSVHGRLVTALQAPVSSSTVRIRRTDDPTLVVILEGATKSDGTFALGPLPAGNYTLETGLISEPKPIREVTVTSAGDEHLGDLILGR